MQKVGRHFCWQGIPPKLRQFVSLKFHGLCNAVDKCLAALTSCTVSSGLHAQRTLVSPVSPFPYGTRTLSVIDGNVNFKGGPLLLKQPNT